MVKTKHFASSGSCLQETLVVRGSVKNGVFTSELITGSLTTEFWIELSELSKKLDKFIELRYRDRGKN